MNNQNLPAVRQEAPVATADTDSWVQMMGPLVKLAESVATTEFVPKNLRGKPAAVTAALLYGREVGLAPMTALTMTHVVEGKPAMSAEGMRALVLSAGHSLEVLEASGAIVRMRARRRGSETWTTLEWSIDMARAAGLLGKDNWKSYPRAMLLARCTAEIARMVFPDVIHGFRAMEELDEVEKDTAAPAAPVQTTTVRRQGRARKAVEAAPRAASTPAAAPSPGVPLPGEEGFEDLGAAAASTAPTGHQPAGSAGDVAASGGSGGEDRSPSSPEPSPGLVGEEAPADTPVVDERPSSPFPTTDTPEQQEQEVAEVVEDQAPPEVERATQAQLARIRMTQYGLGLKAESKADEDRMREERLSLIGRIVRRRIDSSTELSKDEASAVIDTLSRFPAGPGGLADLEALLDAQDEASS